jgi:hypothetical protein
MDPRIQIHTKILGSGTLVFVMDRFFSCA